MIARKQMKWKQAVVEVLHREGAAMHYTAIAENIVLAGLRSKVGATPSTMVNIAITKSINEERDNSPFRRVARGEYVLRQTVENLDGSKAFVTDSGGDDDEFERPIRAFGMFWERDRIAWSKNPSLLGCQQLGADPVDMACQRGVYLLYDGREVIYVGRTTERELGTRLLEHTNDRLRTRWNRFSWFGLRPVSEKGKLREPKTNCEPLHFIAAVESVLIEALEPVQNRRRGDGFTAVEYFQVDDPRADGDNMRKFAEKFDKARRE